MASTDFTVADVLAWARTKPASKRYSYVAHCGCAIFQFLDETGRKPSAAFPGWWEDRDGVEHKFDGAIDEAASYETLGQRTFGGFVKALERAAGQGVRMTPTQLQPPRHKGCAMPAARAATPSGPSLLHVSGIAGIAIAAFAAIYFAAQMLRPVFA